MSYSHYPPHIQTGQQGPVHTPYAYGHYTHPSGGTYAHPQTPGAYPYQAAPGAYGAWPYTYSYIPQQSAHLQQPRPITSTQIQQSAATAAAAAATPVTTAPPQPAALQTRFSAYTPTYIKEGAAPVAAGGTASRSKGRQANFKGLFAKELKSLMYGFGDDRNPANDTVSVMEEILVEFIADVCQTAGAPSKKTRLSVEDLRRALSRPADSKKLARMEELLFMQEDIKRARAQFPEGDIQQTKEF